jgi:class 3 adenylate cyclase
MSIQTESDEIRKLSAIMFTDIQGYSRMMQIDEKQTMKLLEEHNQLLFPIVESKGGQIIKTVGDAILAVFDSCISAVQSAIQIQETLAERANDEEAVTFRVRIGIHLGETVYKENDIFGNSVNIAARLQPLADPGGICMSQTVYEQVQNHYAEKIIRVGPVNLKNISEPVIVYRMQIEGISEVRENQALKFKNAMAEKGQSTHYQNNSSEQSRGSNNTQVQEIVAIMNDVKKIGPWKAAQNIVVRARFSDLLLDFTEAILESDLTEININVTLAGVKIKIPKKYNLINDGYGIAADFKGDDHYLEENTKTIKITGKAKFSEVKISIV